MLNRVPIPDKREGPTKHIKFKSNKNKTKIELK